MNAKPQSDAFARNIPRFTLAAMICTWTLWIAMQQDLWPTLSSILRP